MPDQVRYDTAQAMKGRNETALKDFMKILALMVPRECIGELEEGLRVYTRMCEIAGVMEACETLETKPGTQGAGHAV